MTPRLILFSVSFFLAGFLTGRYYRWCEDGHMLRPRRFIPSDIPVISWGTVVLAIGMIMLGALYYVDHQRWNDYLDCQERVSTAQHERSKPAADLNSAQSASSRANQRVLHIFGEIADFSRMHQNPNDQSAATKKRARVLVSRLAAATHESDRLARKTDRAQADYSDAVSAYPIPLCEGAPQ